MMKMNQNRLVLTLASLAGGIGLGVLISFFLFPPNQEEMDTSPLVEGSIPSTERADAKESQVPTLTSLSTAVALETATERRHALYLLLENKSGEQIAGILRQSHNLDRTKNLYSIQRILFAELSRIEPEKSLEIVWETERIRWGTLLKIVATHWSSFAPEEALRKFSTLEEPWKSLAISTVFQSQASLTDAELTEIAESLEITDHLVRWTVEVEVVEVLDKPQAAFRLALDADISTIDKRNMLVRLARRWTEGESTENIGNMLKLVNEVFTDNEYSLFVPVVAEIAASDPQQAWEQLSSLSQEFREHIVGILFSAWAKHDPIAAIHGLKAQEFMNPTGSEVRYMWRVWVRTISDRFIEHIELVPEDYKISAIDTAVEHLAPNKPPGDMIFFLSQLRELGFDTADATRTVVRYWSQKEPNSAVQWVIENLDLQTTIGQWTLRFACEQLALSDPDKAMEIALEQSAEIALEQSVVMSLLRQGEIDKGLSFFSKIRDSPKFPIPYRNINHILIQAGRIDDVLALANQLEESEIPSFYRSLARPWVRFETESLLEYLPKLRTAEIRRIVASNVLREQESYPYLTEEEFEFVRSFVPDETN